MNTQADNKKKQKKCMQSQSHVTTDGQSASLSWCPAASEAWGAPPTRGQVCRLQLVLVLATAVIRTAVKISGTYLCL
jgi:hypothetical protein